MKHNMNEHNTHTADHVKGGAGSTSRIGTADTRDLGGTGNLGATGTLGADALQLDKEREELSKEEQDFLKLESIFITELGLRGEQLPSFARPATATT